MTFLRAIRAWMPACRTRSGLVLLLVGLWSLAGTVRAVPVAHLYQATVPVASSQASDRSAAFTQALKVVLARIAGNDSVTSLPALSDTLSNAEPLVQSYRYTQGADGQNQIQVTFGAVGVNRALASAGVPVWGANRPLTVVWAAVDTGANRILVTPNSGDWSQAFNQAARTWGLPIVLPRYDSTDQQVVNLSEVWGQFMDSISQASHRYHADLVVAMRIEGQPGQWRASWQMQGGDVQEQGSSTADNPDDLITAVAKAWAGDLAKRYAVSAAAVGSEQSVDLAITGVNGLSDYAGVRQALQGMTPIQEVVPIAITADQLVLRVKFAGELTVLQQYIALDHRFKVAPSTQTYVSLPLVTSAPMTSGPAAASGSAGITSAMSGSSAVGSTSGVNPAAAPSSPPAASSAVPGSAVPGEGNAGAAMADESAEVSAESKNFSRLYPRLHYIWAGRSSGKSPRSNSGSSPDTSGAANGAGASNDQPINAAAPIAEPARAHSGAGDSSANPAASAGQASGQ